MLIYCKKVSFHLPNKPLIHICNQIAHLALICTPCYNALPTLRGLRSQCPHSTIKQDNKLLKQHSTGKMQKSEVFTLLCSGAIPSASCNTNTLLKSSAAYACCAQVLLYLKLLFLLRWLALACDFLHCNVCILCIYIQLTVEWHQMSDMLLFGIFFNFSLFYHAAAEAAV